MMPGSKGLNPHELAHKWVKDLGTRPNMSIKTGTSADKAAGVLFFVCFSQKENAIIVHLRETAKSN